MRLIMEVILNIKHDGVYHEKGTIVESTELAKIFEAIGCVKVKATAAKDPVKAEKKAVKKATKATKKTGSK